MPRFHNTNIRASPDPILHPSRVRPMAGGRSRLRGQLQAPDSSREAPSTHRTTRPEPLTRHRAQQPGVRDVVQVHPLQPRTDADISYAVPHRS